MMQTNDHSQSTPNSLTQPPRSRRGCRGLGSLEFRIALRYIFSKKSHNAINIISGIAVAGITVATVAMVVVMSVFNGFHDLVESFYTEFDPVLKVVPAQGKYFSAERTDSLETLIGKDQSVAAVSRTIEDYALILFRGHPEVITVKGVDDNFPKVTNIRDICYGDGNYQFSRAGVDYAIPGVGLSQLLGGPQFPHMQICAPRGGERINLMDPLESLSVVEVDNTNLVFSVNQRKYDDRYLLMSYALAQQLFEKEGQCTALELALQPGQSVDAAKHRLQQSVTSPEGQARAIVRDRLDQQSETFNVMEIEKLLAYVFLSFILFVACFNIISSVSMLILEKREDARTLTFLGLSQSRLHRIFMLEGQMISLVGITTGVLVGVLLCLAQEQFGLIRLGTGDNFIVQSYPVSVHLQDILAIIVTGLVVGYLATWYPVRYFTKDERKETKDGKP